MDKLLFLEACDKIINVKREKNGIGTLSEKTLHAVLKNYFEPFQENHEIKVGGFVADIVGENGIIEIQTRQFNKLERKLEAFLEYCDVTIVYPIAKTKWLAWINQETGEISKRHKSPHMGTSAEIFDELYRIKYLLDNPRLKLCICMLEIEEYRYLNGWSANKKRGSSRCDRIPTNLIEQIEIERIADYVKLIPQGLAEIFTTKDFQKVTKLSLSSAQTSLNVLNHLNTVKRVGKQGGAYLYEVANPIEKIII